MSLVECLDCRRQVSDRAAACPNCGAPITALPLVIAPPPLPSFRPQRKSQLPLEKSALGISKGIGALILFVVCFALTALSAVISRESTDIAILLGGAIVPFIIGGLILWKRSLRAALVTAVVVVALAYYGNSVGRKAPVSPADKVALQGMEAAFNERKAALKKLANQSAPSAGGTPAKPETETGSVSDQTSMLQRVQSVLQKFQVRATTTDQAYADRVITLHYEEVLAPQRLTTRSGIALSRDAMTRGLIYLNEYEAEWTQLIREFDRDLKDAAAGPSYAAFMRGFEKSKASRDRLSTQVIANQHGLITTATTLIDFMDIRVGRTVVVGGKIMFETDGEVAEYNRLLDEVNRLAAEEQTLRAKTLETLEQSARTLRTLTQR